MIQKVYEIDDLGELKDYLLGVADMDGLRAKLFSEFLGYSNYRNVTEWNRTVRLCECLAIVGWGDWEPLEAIRGTSFNGNPNTYFINRDAKPRFQDAVWSKGKDGMAIDYSLTVWHKSLDSLQYENPVPEKTIGEVQNEALKSQRNWIAKNPILITRGLANCYENSKPLIASLDNELMPELNRFMRPELYGTAIDRIVLNCSFSFYDDYHCKTNYIIADESLKLKPKDYYPVLLTMFSEKEIEDNGYYLRNRFTYGPFRADTGMVRIVIVLEKAFSELPHSRQRKVLSEYFLHAVRHFAARAAKRVDYKFNLMISDFSAILGRWCENNDQCPLL